MTTPTNRPYDPNQPYGQQPYGQAQPTYGQQPGAPTYGQTEPGAPTYGEQPSAPSYGQTEPGAPSYGQQPYGGYGQQPYGTGRPPGKAPMEGFAIAGFIVSLIGGVLLGPILCVVALIRIRNSGNRGRGLAIAGLIIGLLWIVLVAVLVVVGMKGQPTRDKSTGEVTEPGTVTLEDLKRGDCVGSLDGPDDTVFYNLKLVPCTSPHAAEAYARFSLPKAATYPGAPQVQKEADRGCGKRASNAVASRPDADNIGLSYLYPPTAEDWSRSRSVVCFYTAVKGQLTTKIDGSSQTAS